MCWSPAFFFLVCVVWYWMQKPFKFKGATSTVRTDSPRNLFSSSRARDIHSPLCMRESWIRPRQLKCCASLLMSHWIQWDISIQQGIGAVQPDPMHVDSARNPTVFTVAYFQVHLHSLHFKATYQVMYLYTHCMDLVLLFCFACKANYFLVWVLGWWQWPILQSLWIRLQSCTQLDLFLIRQL